MILDYCCHDHGIVGQGDTLQEHDRRQRCPVCDGPLFVAVSDSPFVAPQRPPGTDGRHGPSTRPEALVEILP